MIYGSYWEKTDFIYINVSINVHVFLNTIGPLENRWSFQVPGHPPGVDCLVFQ